MPKPPTISDPDTEVVPDPINDRPQRRRWTAVQKKRILDAADACQNRGDVGELLRKEGIYSSHLHNWRKQLTRHGMKGLEPKRAGRKPTRDKSALEIARLQGKNHRLAAELLLTRKVIELQVKAHEILGITLPSIEDDSST